MTPTQHAYTRRSNPALSGLVIGLLSGVLHGWMPALNAPLAAQERSGPLLRSGLVRFDFSLSHSLWDLRFAEVDDEPISADFASESVGVDLFPGIASLEEALTRTDASGTTVNMGATRVQLSQERITVPFRVEIGVFDRLSVGTTVPLVRRRAEIGIGVDASAANAGVSPTLTDPSAVSDFLGAFRAATDGLEVAAQGVCDAQGVGSTPCIEALELAGRSEAFRSSLAAAYTDSPAFPFAGTDAADALLGELSELSTAAGTLGVNGLPTALPLATATLGTEALQTVISDPQGPIRGLPLADWRSPWELGDIEAFAHLRLLGTSLLQAPRSGLQFELGVGGLVRLGTAVADSTENFVDLGTGDGTMDYEGRAFLHLRHGGRIGLWTEARYGVQGSTQLVRRVGAPDTPLRPASSRATVEWSPGDYWRLDVVPRLHLTNEVAIVGVLTHTSKAEDEYTFVGAAPAGVPDASILARDSERTLTEVGAGLVFSSAASPSGRRMEVRFQYLSAVAGSARTPKAPRMEFGMRLFRSFWGGSTAP